MNKPLLTPHHEIGLEQSSWLNHGCLIYRLYSSKWSMLLSNDSWAMVSVAFPFFSFFLIKSSIHASVDESTNKETQYNLYWVEFFLIKSSIHASVNESANKEIQYKLIQPKEKGTSWHRYWWRRGQPFLSLRCFIPCLIDEKLKVI